VLHALEVFSKFTPNPRKEIQKQKNLYKLSIENNISNKMSKSSSKKSLKSDKQPEVGSALLKNPDGSPGVKSITKRKQHKRVLGNFLQEIGISHQNYGPMNKDLLEDLDDGVLSNLSNEIIKHKQKKKKKQKNAEATGDLLLVKSFGGQKKQQAKKH